MNLRERLRELQGLKGNFKTLSVSEAVSDTD